MNLGMLPEPVGPVTVRRSPRAGRWVLLAIVLVVCAGAVAATFRAARDNGANEPAMPPRAPVVDTSARAPQGVRVRVRVLNTTTTRGLAKRATFALRDLGYDVVDFDSDSRSRRSTTLILSHTGHADWAQRLQRALGTGAVEARADTLRYVDFTVMLGSDWKAPAQPFRP